MGPFWRERTPQSGTSRASSPSPRDEGGDAEALLGHLEDHTALRESGDERGAEAGIGEVTAEPIVDDGRLDKRGSVRP